MTLSTPSNLYRRLAPASWSPITPTLLGAPCQSKRKKSLVSILSKYQVPLIEDDIYGDLCQSGDRRPVTAKAFDTDGLVLLCSSISKTLAPGLRVGWIAPGRFRDQILQLKTNQTLACPTITQMAVAEFLAHGSYDAHLRKIRTLFANQLQLFSSSVSRYFPSGTRVSRPQGGFVLWIELDSKLSTTELAARAISQYGIAIAPHVFLCKRQKLPQLHAHQLRAPLVRPHGTSHSNPGHPGQALRKCQYQCQCQCQCQCQWEKRE